MNYLAIDASTEACSVALIYNEQLYTQFEVCPQSHSVLLLPMVDKVLTQAGCQLKDLDGLIYGRGPGSFTGVRIGIGVAQGLAFAADLPVVGVSTLQAMAQQALRRFDQNHVIAAIDARMSEIYTCAYQQENGLMKPTIEESVIAPSKATEQYSQAAFPVGTGWESYQQELAELNSQQQLPEIQFPDAIDMLTIGSAMFEQGKGQSAEHAQPVYVRDTVSWKKLPGR